MDKLTISASQDDKIIDIDCLQSSSASELIGLLREKVKDGWILRGEIFFIANFHPAYRYAEKNKGIFYQTIVKY